MDIVKKPGKKRHKERDKGTRDRFFSDGSIYLRVI